MSFGMSEFHGERLILLGLTTSPTRIMMTGFLEGHQANGAFVAVGPPGKSYLRASREMCTLTN